MRPNEPETQARNWEYPRAFYPLGDGTYTAIYTATTTGNWSLAATINGQPLTSTTPILTVTPARRG